MDQLTAFVPKCKKDVVVQIVGGILHRCPVCGFEYELSPPIIDSGAGPSAAGEFFTILGRLLLIMVALAVVGFAVLYAGCALLMGSWH